MIEHFIRGNSGGIGKHTWEQIMSWQDYVLPKSVIVDAELANFLLAITQKLKQEVAVYINRQGRLVCFMIGNSDTVSLVSAAARRSPRQLSGLRCIHTHPKGSGRLSDLDISAAFRLRLDCMVALGAEAGAGTVGLVWGGPLKMEKMQPFLLASLQSLLEIDFWQEIQTLEKQRRAAMAEEQIDETERGILAALSAGRSEEEVAASLAELASLAQTAQVTVLQTVVQRKEKPSPGTYLHAGKAQELAQLAQTSGANVLIIDDEMNHAQMARLADLVGIKVIDRSMLILDIFARRARSNEGKLQVELAQMHYTLPRIMGQGLQLSRLAGGIGTRGPGESKLEMDRRRIRRRIQDLEEQLAQVRRTRDLHRQKRRAEELPVVALVGYTNAGKTTLLNTLTAADAFAEDLLFATLDPLTRRVSSPCSGDFLLSDTVGFIRRLPHHLIAAFRATLEEVTEADLILHVVDAAAADWQAQADAVLEVLAELKALAKPRITVLNKVDLVVEEGQIQHLLKIYPQSVAVSAQANLGLDRLLQVIDRHLPEKMREMLVLLPYDKSRLLAKLHEEGQVLAQEYLAEGIKLRIKAPPQYWAELTSLQISEETP